MTTLFTNGNLVDVIGQTVLAGGSILEATRTGLDNVWFL